MVLQVEKIEDILLVSLKTCQFNEGKYQSVKRKVNDVTERKYNLKSGQASWSLMYRSISNEDCLIQIYYKPFDDFDYK